MAHSAQSKWLIFVLVAIAQFMVVLDISITNVALPSIKTALQFGSDSALQWVITAYALTFGGFLLLGDRAADLFGRRRTLLIGMSCFTIISFLIGFSPSAPVLIGLRAAQGLAAATSGVPAEEGGLASGMITTSQQMGGAVGLSVLSGIVTVAAKSTNAEALVQSYREAFGAAVIFACFAFLIALLVIRERKGQPQATQYAAH